MDESADVLCGPTCVIGTVRSDSGAGRALRGAVIVSTPSDERVDVTLMGFTSPGVTLKILKKQNNLVKIHKLVGFY